MTFLTWKRAINEQKQAWSKEASNEFSIYKLITWPMGSWPLDSEHYFSGFRMLFACVLQIMMVTDYLTELVRNRTMDTCFLIDIFALSACAILTVVKVVTIRVYRRDIVEHMRSANNDWTLTQRKNHREIMSHYAGVARSVFFIQMIPSYVSCSTIIFSPMLSSTSSYLASLNSSSVNVSKLAFTKNMPLGTSCLYRESESFPYACHVFYILQCLEILTTATGNIGSDVFLFGITMHLCAQLEILKDRFLKLDVEGKVKECKRKLQDLIERHCKLFGLAKQMEYILRWILMAQLFLNGLHICLLGVQLIVALDENSGVLVTRTVISFDVLMLQLFLYSFIGETLSSKLEAIGVSVYLSNWYDLPPRVVKDLRFIMARASIPFYITAGKFYEMNLNSFKNILKASLSYFSVLRFMLSD